MARKENSDYKVFVAGTRDRLFVASSIRFCEAGEGRWFLTDRRGNSYCHGTPDEIYTHIDEMVEIGKYELRP
ncbi:MAG: hypothetical protein MdMp014T_0915 [Treponematales bacterium]